MGIWSRFNRRARRGAPSAVPQTTHATQTKGKQSDEEDEFCEARPFFSNDIINRTINKTPPGLMPQDESVDDGNDVETARESSPVIVRESKSRLHLPINAPMPKIKVRIRSRSRARTVSGMQKEIKKLKGLGKCKQVQVDTGSRTTKTIPRGRTLPCLVRRKSDVVVNTVIPSTVGPLPETFTPSKLPEELPAINTPLADAINGTESAREELNVEAIHTLTSTPLTATGVKIQHHQPSTPLSELHPSAISIKIPPPPPPPPPSFLNSNRSLKESLPYNSSRRQDIFSNIPSPSRPTIHVWGSFLDKNPESTRQTIWEKFNTEQNKVDTFKQVENVFAEKTKTVRLPKINPFKKKSKTEKTIPGLTIRNAFLLSLAVNNFKCSKEELVRRINEAEYESVDIHLWKSLKESFPNTDELDQFKQLESPAGLDDSYEFCYHACKVGFIGQKLKCVHLLSQITEKICDLKENKIKTERVIATAKLLEENEECIRKIMFSTLTLVNFLNKGTTNEASPGFQLGSFVKFLQIKGDGKILAWFVYEENSDLHSKFQNLNECLKGSRSIDLGNIKDELDESRKTARDLTDLIVVWKESDVYSKCLTHIQNLEDEIKNSEDLLRTLYEIEKTLKIKYCAKQSHLDDIFKQFHEAFQIILKEKH